MSYAPARISMHTYLFNNMLVLTSCRATRDGREGRASGGVESRMGLRANYETSGTDIGDGTTW